MIKLNDILLAIGIICVLILTPIEGIGGGHSEQGTSDPETKAIEGKHKTVNLDIGGMVCSSCSEGLIETLEDIAGVIKTDISYKENGGAVVYDPILLNEKKILKAIRKSGFKASIKKCKNNQKSASETISG